MAAQHSSSSVVAQHVLLVNEDIYVAILSNQGLILALFACALAQFAKIFTHWYETQGSGTKRWDWKKMFTSGGMPSSHSSAVCCMAATCGLTDGFHSNNFAIATVLALIVMYDATGVRLHAGKQAEVLNQILVELPLGGDVPRERLRDHLGHTPPQVAAGAIVGIVVAYFGHMLPWRETLDDM